MPVAATDGPERQNFAGEEIGGLTRLRLYFARNGLLTGARWEGPAQQIVNEQHRYIRVVAGDIGIIFGQAYQCG